MRKLKEVTTQYQAIIVLLLKDWTSAIGAFQFAGTIKLSTRCSELSKDFTIEKRKVDAISRFGHSYYYFEYKILRDDRLEKGLKKYKL
ncbi:hypothetical protein Q2324_26815 [Escherichia coli]|nr:hypothetical protein [Escherichia coli]